MKYIKLLFSFVFSRLFIIILILLVQIFLLTLGFKFFYENIIIIFGGLSLLSLIIVTYLLKKEENLNYKLAWVLLILGIPAIGSFIYIFVELQLSTKVLTKKLQNNRNESLKYIHQDLDVINDIKDDNLKCLVNYINNYGKFPIYECNNIKYFPFGDDKFEDLKEELKNAKKFIFLEYFIISKGELLDSIIDILKEKVKENVEVRIIFDGTCEFSGISYNYPKELAKYGIKSKIFLPFNGTVSMYLNSRDHRKIAIIDGIIAYTGGANIADEYINKKERFGKWKDTAIKVSGRCVNTFTSLFLEMWNIDKKEMDDYNKYLNNIEEKSKNFVVPFGDNPLDKEPIAKNIYMNIINNARKYVYIMTPYLIPDDDLLSAIKFASKRGIDVRIIMPHIPDKKFVYYLGRSYYEELIKSGVKIYEYKPGFVHAKVFVSDDILSVVGTINLDYRSLYLNFECGCYIYNSEVVYDIKDDFIKTLKNSIIIDKKNIKEFNIIKKIIGVILRFLSPLI